MYANTRQIKVRNASSAGNDAEFIMAAWDSTLPFLASIGAGEMWGEQPFSERDGSMEEIVEIVQKSEEDESNDNRRLLVAELEIEINGTATVTQVGAAIICDAIPHYLAKIEELKTEVENAGLLLYVEVLIADHRSSNRFRGVGPALIDAIKARAMGRGKNAVYLDAWVGNERKMNRYYENIGFKNVGDFSLTRRNGTTWRGTLYRIDLATT